MSAVTTLPPPVSVTPQYQPDAGEVVVTWTLADDAPDGSIGVERSDDGGATWTTVATGLALADTEFVDTSISPGDPIYYRIVRSTAHATTRSDPAELLGPAVEVAIQSTNSPVEAGEPLEIPVEVTNLGGAGTETLTLEITEQ
ncbi:hypothetical protein Z052_02075 [Halorubrum sp. C191]|nr:hypothetical protein Z052_02075 [Halorubrum sp. C191]